MPRARDEIVFTKGGTEAINLVAYSFLAPRIEPGDEIVLTVMEHHSNIVPWHFLRERQGAVLKWVDVRDDGSLDIEALDAAIGPKTKLVAVAHMSNVLGTVTPLKEIVARAHAKGVPVLADGCQGAVHVPVDVQDLDVDFYALTGHKLYGPTGIGALYAKRAHLKTMRPFNGGGEMIGEVDARAHHLCRSAGALRGRHAADHRGGGAACGASTTFRRSIARRSPRMSTICWPMRRDAVKALNWVRVIGDAPGKGAILSFEAEGMHAHDLATILDREGVAVRAGHHCAQALMERFGVASTTRASFALYNTREDVDRVCRSACTRRGRFWVDDDGRVAARALPGCDPRSLQASAPFRQAGRRHPYGEGYNPLCGDKVKVYLAVDGDGRIADIKFEGRGCAISQASASLMTDMLVGRTRRRSRKADGRVPASGEGRGCGRSGRGRPRDAGCHGRRFGIPHAREMRDAGLAYHEIGAGGRGRPRKPNERRTQPAMQMESVSSALSPEELEAFTQKLVAALKTVYDPEIPVDIYELGLIYKVDVADNKDVAVDMTLTAPGCPVAGEMPGMVEEALGSRGRHRQGRR